VFLKPTRNLLAVIYFSRAIGYESLDTHKLHNRTHAWSDASEQQIMIIITRDLYCAAKCRSKHRGAGHCTSATRMTSILRHVAEAFPLARQGTILHRVIGIATNTSRVLNCTLVTYLMVTADVGDLLAV